MKEVKETTDKQGNKIFQLTENVFINGTTLKLYDLEGNYIGHLNTDTEQLIYNDDLPEQLKSEMGIVLMLLQSQAEA